MLEELPYGFRCRTGTRDNDDISTEIMAFFETDEATGFWSQYFDPDHREAMVQFTDADTALQCKLRFG